MNTIYVIILNMKFLKKIYFGKNASEHSRRLIWKIRHGAGTFDVYVICLPSFSEDPLEIMNAAVLRQHYYRKFPPVIVGIASGYNEALEVVRDIMDDCVAATGEYKLRNFLTERIKKDGGHI